MGGCLVGVTGGDSIHEDQPNGWIGECELQRVCKRLRAARREAAGVEDRSRCRENAPPSTDLARTSPLRQLSQFARFRTPPTTVAAGRG